MNVDTSQSSTYTNAAYSSKGFSGMASGIDTESLVQSMLSNIQNKIDKQNQEKQRLEWKQEIYRDIISDINNFQSKYFNLTSSSSLRLTSFFNTVKTSSSSSAVKVTPGSNATDTQFKMQVARLASASSVSSSKVAGSGEIALSGAKSGSFEYSRNIDININGTNYSVDLKGVTDADEIAQRINNAVGSNFASVNKENVYKDASGNVVNFNTTDNQYYNQDGTVYTGSVTTETNATGITFSTSDSFEISGSAAGMAIVGLSGSVKSSAAKDAAGNEIAGQFEVKTTAVNEQFAETGKVNGTVDVTLDGIRKSIAVAEGESMADFQKKVQSAFGNSVQFKEENGEWKISVNGKGRNLTISANADTMEAIGFDKGTTAVSSQILRSDSLGKLGVVNANDKNTTYSFDINGKTIEYTSEDTVSSIMNKINSSGAGVTMSYNDLSDKFQIQSNSTGEGYDLNITGDTQGLFAKFGFDMNGDSIDSSSVVKGQNAVVNINGVTVERASNNFTYNGLNISLNSTTGTYETDANGNFVENSDGTMKAAAGTVEQKAEITTTRDTDKIVDTLKSFVEDYNKMIEKLNKYTHEKASYKSYAPLTEAQKKQMSEKEIELWEEKSKEGLLRSDKDVNSFLSDMRSAMYTSAGSRLSLSSIGINSSSNWQDYGKLEIDEDKLRSALETDAEGVQELFTGTNGLATRLSKICDKTANTSSGKPGSLVQMAGVVGKGTESNNMIKEKLDAITKKLNSLNMLYEKRKDRYWKQFNAMETALSNMNSQSSWLSNMIGY